MNEILSTGQIIIGACFIAALIEAITEYVFGVPFEKFPKIAPYKWMLGYIAVILGILAAFIGNLDWVAITANIISPGIIQSSWFTLVMSGVLLGRGAEWLHRFTSQWLPTKTNFDKG